MGELGFDPIQPGAVGGAAAFDSVFAEGPGPRWVMDEYGTNDTTISLEVLDMLTGRFAMLPRLTGLGG